MTKKEEIQRAFNAGISAAHFAINHTAEPKYASSNDYWEKEHGHEEEDFGPEYDSAGYSEEDRTNDDRPMSMFTANNNQGYTMRFNNGMVISVQWSKHNYCHNRSMHFNDPKFPGSNSSINAEMAIWDKNGNYYMFEDGRFNKGWVDADEVAAWINVVSMARHLTHLEKLARTHQLIMPI